MVEAQHGAGLTVDLVGVVGGQQEGHHRPGGSGRRFDDMGHVALAAGLVEVLERLARGLGVLGEVVVASVGDALELAPPPGVEELHVGCGRRVVAELLGVVGAQPQSVGRHAEVEVPLVALVAPVLEPAPGLARLHEVLQLHLLELSGAEDEVAGSDLVAERLAHLGDPEGRALAGGVEHVLEVDEHALRRLRAQVGDSGVGLDRPGVGLEHEVELAGVGEAVGSAAVRAGAPVLELVEPEALPAHPAVDQGIGEAAQVTGCLPDGGRRQDGGVEADDVVAQLDHRAPPRRFDVAQHQDAHGAVVVGRAEPAVDLGRREDEPPAPAQVHHLVEVVGHAGERSGAPDRGPR